MIDDFPRDDSHRRENSTQRNKHRPFCHSPNSFLAHIGKKKQCKLQKHKVLYFSQYSFSECKNFCAAVNAKFVNYGYLVR